MLTHAFHACRYPNKGDTDKKGVLLVVTSGKDGALSGGPAFMSALGDDFVDSIVGENIAIFTTVRSLLSSRLEMLPFVVFYI